MAFPPPVSTALPTTPQTYEAWYGYSSLPKLQANSTQARDLIWAQTDSVARYWLDQGADGWRLDVGGDVDPGVTNAPSQRLLGRLPRRAPCR